MTSSAKGEKIIIIDGSGYIFRAYYAIQRLSTSQGFPTNAIFGFVNMLARVLEVEKPHKLVIVFDTPKPTFRKEIYAEYKANRSAPPEDLVAQIPHIQRAVDCFGIRRMQMEGFEADDVIGTLAKRAAEEGHPVEIITGDKDLMQLVDDNVTLYDSMKDKRIGEAGVVERFGVKPSQVVDFLALMGDSSDNIPGVSGIGEKTAAELISTFGSLEGLYQNLDQVKQNKRRETLLKEKETAFLSQKLAKVKCDLPLRFTWKEMDYNGPRNDELQAFFQEMEFHNLLKRFDLKPKEEGEGFKKGKYETVATLEKLEKVVKQLGSHALLSVDTETTSLTVHDAKLVGVSLCAKEGEAYYIPIGHHGPPEPDGTSALAAGQIDETVALQHLKPLLEKASVRKVGQNLKYDMQIFRRWGVSLNGIASDTMIASYLLDPDQAHNLDALALRHLNHKNIAYEDVTGSGRSQISFAEVSIEKATEYSAEDADVAFRLNEKLVPQLEKLEMSRLYQDIELPLIEVLAEWSIAEFSSTRIAATDGRVTHRRDHRRREEDIRAGRRAHQH